MLKFITGAAGTGKSTRLREEITALAEKEKRVLCLVPEQYSFETERVLYPTGAEVYSMERLADAVFRSLRRAGGRIRRGNLPAAADAPAARRPQGDADGL